ncbi:MAG TPA: tail fiber domain-containing protein [Pyrinomonadaceae bacterium]
MSATISSKDFPFVSNGRAPERSSYKITPRHYRQLHNCEQQHYRPGINVSNAYGCQIGNVTALWATNSSTGAGFQAGLNNTGTDNSFFGQSAGQQSDSGSNNSFFGATAGYLNGGGSENSFFGYLSGNDSQGNKNSFFGVRAGLGNGTGNSNSLFGYNAATVGALSNATAIGANSQVNQSNALILGSINGVNNSLVDTNVGIGTITPTFKLQVFDSSNKGLRVQTNVLGGTVASFGTSGAFQIDAAGTAGGRLNILENGNVGLGTGNPIYKLHVVGNSSPTEKLQVTGNTAVSGRFTVNGGINYFGTSGNANFFMKSAGAANSFNFGVAGVAGTNSVLYISQYDGATYQDRLIIDTFGVVKMPRNVVIGTAPNVDQLYVNGVVSMNLGTFGTQAVCRNTAVGVLTLCSSSIRYKQNVKDYKPGLELIRRLRPVSFNWKVTNEADFGLVAEEVAEVEPLMIIRNDKGEVEGVKYDRVGVVPVNAVGEQHDRIEAQQKQIEEQKTQIEVQQKQTDSQAELIRQQQEKLDKQQSEIEALKSIVCAGSPAAKICREEKP